MVGVFDGAGGAGAHIDRVGSDGTPRTSAWVGARLAREVTQDWFTARSVSREGLDPASLAHHLTTWLRQEGARAASSGPVVRGSLHRVLPTTLAAVAVRPRQREAVADVFWAGDSRCFILRPDHGLQVLTVDDTPETDAMALIRDDQPMENLVSADRSFRVNHRRLRLTVPAVLIAATDGCYGYVQTPAHFEYHLLDTLATAATPGEWVQALMDRLAGFTGDDASLVISCPGLSDLGRLRQAMAPRLERVRAEHWQPFVGCPPDQLDGAREASWAAYRSTYEARMRPGAEP